MTALFCCICAFKQPSHHDNSLPLIHGYSLCCLRRTSLNVIRLINEALNFDRSALGELLRLTNEPYALSSQRTLDATRRGLASTSHECWLQWLPCEGHDRPQTRQEHFRGPTPHTLTQNAICPRQGSRKALREMLVEQKVVVST